MPPCHQCGRTSRAHVHESAQRRYLTDRIAFAMGFLSGALTIALVALLHG